MSKRTSFGQSGNLIAYFGLAYAISWSIGIPLALAARGIIPQVLPAWAHYFVAYGPMVSAIVVTLVAEGPSGFGKLAKRVVM